MRQESRLVRVKRRVGQKNKVESSPQKSRPGGPGHFRNSGDSQRNKKRPWKFNNTQTDQKLPDDLVLTTLTDQGPKRARSKRIDFHSLPAELVLTELTEDGPRPKEDDDRV